jgi:DNA end-binding protein Ku
MAVRPSWEGHLRLSLVTCPVALYPATGEAEEVSRGGLVKGFEIGKNEYVLLDKDNFEKVKLESTRIIDIEKFVPAESIDRLYWDTAYHLVPSGKTGVEAFAVIREAMNRKGMVAIGRLVMSTRERICGIEIEEAGLRLTTLRTAEESPGHGRNADVTASKAGPANAGHRREDCGAAGRRVRPFRVRQPLRGRAACHDRGEKERPRRPAKAGGQRRQQGD